MIVVVSNLRVGSSSFVKDLSKTTGLSLYHKYTGEFLNLKYKKPKDSIEIYKIIPSQLNGNWDRFKKDYLDNAGTIFYLARRNFKEQLKSFITCTITQDWHPETKEPKHLYTPVALNINPNRRLVAGHYHTLKRIYEQQQKLFKEYPGKVLYLEDRYDEDKKYVRPINWLYKPKLPLINPEEYFR